MVDINKTMLSKMDWFLASNNDSLAAKLLTNKYGNIMIPRNRRASTCSPSWKDLQVCWKVIQSCCCKLIGNEEQTKVWSDPWIPSISTFEPHPSPSCTMIDNTLTVVDLISDGKWNLPLSEALFDSNTIQNILKIHLNSSDTEDSYIWTRNKSGLHIVRNYHLTDQNARFKKGIEVF